MPGLSKVIVLDPDARAGRQVQLGFQREDVPVEVAAVPGDPAALAIPAGDTGLVIVGGAEDRALELVRQARARLGEAEVDVPIVFAGRGVRRTDAEAAGADEVLLAPAYLRDVVTIGRLLRDQPAARREHLIGSLAQATSVLSLVRALAALGRSAVLTLTRGLRRGEVRFYHGEVTSAQVGMINGQAALHQLLLWTDARFDFYREDIVRRHQIPLDRDDLFADAERFLTGVRESSGRLSPSMVLEQDRARLLDLEKEIPAEVHGILRMFDGHRVLADVLEDSPYRVFETLRVTQLALSAGLLRHGTKPRPRTTWRAVLAIEEWLVGAETRDDVLERHAGESSAPVPRAAADGPSASSKSGRSKGSRRKRKKRRPNTPPPAAAPAGKPEIDWGALVPRIAAAEVGPLAGVVPVSHTSGEITMSPPDQPAGPTAPMPGAPAAPAAEPNPDPELEPEPPSVVVELAADEPEVGAAPEGAPTRELTDEASDGVIRETILTVDTAPAPHRPPPEIPEDDRPEDATGEIVTKTGQIAAVEPPAMSEPSILVADLGDVQAAALAVAEAQAAAPATPSMATPVAEQTVAEVREGAADAFTSVEEDFFRAGQEKAKRPPTNQDSFDDLDEGYKPVGFWNRLLGRKPKR